MSHNSIKQTEIKHILKLEQLFHNRFLTQELLNQLVSLYVKAIGSLGESLSVMKIYFLDKMQFLLSRPQIQKLLIEEQSEKSTRDKYTIKISSLQLEYECSQYVKKSSLHSQPVGKKLSEIMNEDEKIRERQSRIRNQLELMKEMEQKDNLIELQEGGISRNYEDVHKMGESQKGEGESEEGRKLSGGLRVIRKSSEGIERKGGKVQDRLGGKRAEKEWLLEIKREKQERLSRQLEDDDYRRMEFPSSVTQQNIERVNKEKVNNNGKGLGFKSFGIIDLSEDDERNGINVKNEKRDREMRDRENEENSSLWRVEKDEFLTFAEELNTPEFGAWRSSRLNKLSYNVFSEDFTEIRKEQIGEQCMRREVENGQNQEIQEKEEDQNQVVVFEQETQKDYKQDEYF